MSLLLALNNSVSGLLTAQRGLDAIANNVANVNTVGYTRKTLQPESRIMAGHGAGVQVGDLTRSVDEGLLTNIRGAASNLAQYSVSDSFFQRLQDLFGSTAANSSISHTINRLTTAFEGLAADVNKPTTQAITVQAAIDLVDQLETMGTSIQQLRLDADRDIAEVVTSINEQLAIIADMNEKVARNHAAGIETGDLVDKRDVALTRLSEMIDIRYFTRTDGSISVLTGSGMTLVDGAHFTVDYTGTTQMSATMTYAGGDFGKLTVRGIDITGQVQSGELRALLEMRDTTLPNLQAEIDSLAWSLKETVNQIHNRGTSYPTLRDTMSGTRHFTDSATQTITFGGTTDTVMALFDSSGTQVASTTIQTLLGGAGPHTVDDVAAAMQAWLVGQGYASATVDMSAGNMEIDLGTTDVGLAFRDQSATAAGSSATDAEIGFDADGDGAIDRTIKGFSNFFGLNDLFVTGRQTDLLESEIKLPTYKTPAATTISFADAGGPIGTMPIAIPAGSTLADIEALIDRFATTYESPVVGGAAAGGTLTISSNSGPLGGTLTINPGDDLATIAGLINADAGYAAAGVTATVVDDGTGARLRVTDAEGDPLFFTGTLGADIPITATKRIEADVVPEGSGFRLRVLHSTGLETTATGTLVDTIKLNPGAGRAAGDLDVRSDLANQPSLLSRGAVQYNSDLGKYFLSEGDNQTALQLSTVMTTKTAIKAAGDLAAGNYTFAEYAAATISLNSRAASHVADQVGYTKALRESLEFKHGSISGVNLDEEMAQLMVWQQAYAASAKVISTTQQMFDVLDNILR